MRIITFFKEFMTTNARFGHMFLSRLYIAFNLIRVLISSLSIIMISLLPLKAQEEDVDSIFRRLESMSNEEIILADSLRYPILIQLFEGLNPGGRVSVPFLPDSNLVILISTSQDSLARNHSQDRPHFKEYYFEPKGISYASTLEKLYLLNEPDEKTIYWLDSWQLFFPDQEYDFILIEVSPSKLEASCFKRQ